MTNHRKHLTGSEVEKLIAVSPALSIHPVKLGSSRAYFD
jgi:hypothetical protein